LSHRESRRNQVPKYQRKTKKCELSVMPQKNESLWWVARRAVRRSKRAWGLR
jgi:hypothetical protein